MESILKIQWILLGSVAHLRLEKNVFITNRLIIQGLKAWKQTIENKVQFRFHFYLFRFLT